jgi:hypothetical protein
MVSGSRTRMGRTLQRTEQAEARSVSTEKWAIVDDPRAAEDVLLGVGTPHAAQQQDPSSPRMKCAPSAAWPAVILMKQALPARPEDVPPLPFEVSDVVAAVRAREHDPFGTDLKVEAVGDRGRPSARLRLKWDKNERPHECTHQDSLRHRHVSHADGAL